MKEKIKNGLTERQKRRLEALDNPSIKSFNTTFLIATGILGRFWLGLVSPRFIPIKKRREKVASLRTKMRMAELKLDPNKDYQTYYRIRREEKERFDKRFGIAK